MFKNVKLKVKQALKILATLLKSPTLFCGWSLEVELVGLSVSRFELYCTSLETQLLQLVSALSQLQFAFLLSSCDGERPATTEFRLPFRVQHSAREVFSFVEESFA